MNRQAVFSPVLVTIWSCVFMVFAVFLAPWTMIRLVLWFPFLQPPNYLSLRLFVIVCQATFWTGLMAYWLQLKVMPAWYLITSIFVLYELAEWVVLLLFGWSFYGWMSLWFYILSTGVVSAHYIAHDQRYWCVRKHFK